MKLEFILVSLLQGVSSSQLDCPNVVELGSSARLLWSETQTNISSISWTNPDGVLAGNCISNGCENTNGYTVERNTTRSELNILKVGFKDIGAWTCATPSSKSQCTVEGYKIPTCNITSNNRTDELSLHEPLFLTVDIRGYNCSTAFNFSVQTGAVTKLLPTSVPDVSDYITPTSLTVTEAHLGGVRLIFRCHTEQWNLTCDGVTQLIKSNDAGASNNVDIGTEQTTIIVAVSSSLVLIMVVVVVVVFLIYRKQKHLHESDQ
ncbi:uncharacterized protein [Haliotis cracherodii]|uniref:uncharacterized protein isoform X2 n=1 Tax=Haliotis cracherodii TaxID=6455 RepID=UPI0039EAEEAE